MALRAICTGLLFGLVALAQAPAGLIIDGNVDDPFWAPAARQSLMPGEAGVPAELGGTVAVAMRGDYLCVLAHLPEAGGRVLARSIGRNPVWALDATLSPPVEDRLRVVLTRGNALPVSIEVNPWGAWRLEQGGEVGIAKVMTAAVVRGDAWDVEAAIPLGGVFRAPGATGVRVERIRSRRALAPEFRWVWPAAEAVPLTLPVGSANEAAPQHQPPVIGNRDAAVRPGYSLTLPALSAGWDDPAWSGIPSFELRAGAAYATAVRWVHDGRTLAVFVRAAEPEPVVARAGGRDSSVTGDDHIAIRLATTGSAYVEFAVNSVGAIYDSLGTGPRMERPRAGWNAAGVRTHTDIRYGYWTARIDIPLAESAAALGETGLPRDWRFVLSRLRAARGGEAAEISALPAIEAGTFYGPARYRRMRIDEGPAMLPGAPSAAPALTGLAGALAAMDSNVWTAAERRARGARNTLGAQQRRRVINAVLEERKELDRIQTRQDWEQYRTKRMAALRASIGAFPPERAPLDTRVTATRAGAGYRIENLVYQTRPGFYAAANLYLPAQSAGPWPVIVIQHSQHFPRTQGELHDMGELWARKGAAVLLIERLGFGERTETTPAYRQAYQSRFTFRKQLNLVGESHIAWMAWDIMRAVDLLTERPDIDAGKIVLIGSVAGGGEPAALAAALDERIAAVAPFNYEMGHVRLDADYPGEIAKHLSPWFIAASIAPRKYIRAFEFGWEGAEEADYPEVWESGWERSQRIWGLYGARENLAATQAFGLIRLSVERIQHCFSVGPAQRKEMFPLFERWFQIPSAAAEDAGTLPDSELTYHNNREAARVQEMSRRRAHADLLAITPKVNAELKRRGMHEIVREMAVRNVEAARQKRGGAEGLRRELRPILGNIDAAGGARFQSAWQRNVNGVRVEGGWIRVEEGIDVPLVVLKSASTGAAKLPVVVVIDQQGKRAFVRQRAGELARLVQSGVAVVIPDVRGAGETSPDAGGAAAYAQLELALGNSLVGARIRDVRTVLAYLRTRTDLDSARVALWGDGMGAWNSERLVLDEMEFEGGPEIQHQARSGGALVAMLTALYESGVRGVAAHGGLAEFASVLDAPFTYIPADALVPGILKTADVADVAAALAPRALLIASPVDGRNVLLGKAAAERAMGPAIKSYAPHGGRFTLIAGDPATSVADWLAAAVKN